HGLFQQIAARHGVTIAYRPMPIVDVFEATGSLPLPKRPPARQRYRWMELQRWRDRRALPLVFKPKHFPLDPTLANRTIVAAIASGVDPSNLIGRMLAAVWAEDRNLADEATIRSIVSGCGLDAEALLSAARSEAVGEAYRRNGADAIAADVFGAPCYVLDGEVFWGQDRLELLDDALASGRKAYLPL
ncbi:MAG: 2-hydroxychromene-2-carboxylate isomerase, partial [Beijerinckiaceae bacterium]